MITSREVAFDIEADNLLDKVSKVWCLCYRYVDSPEEVFTCTTKEQIQQFFKDCEANGHVLVGHNIICYDFPVLEKILGIKWTGKTVDTLPMSWYLHHSRIKHGLESYGEDFGVPKPVIDNWETQTLDDYIHRCKEDCLIQVKTWLQLKQKLQELYNDV